MMSTPTCLDDLRLKWLSALGEWRHSDRKGPKPGSAPGRESYVILFASRNHGRDCNRVVTRGKAIRFTVPSFKKKSSSDSTANQNPETRDATVMATYKRYKLLYRNHDFLARRLSSKDTHLLVKADAKGERIGPSKEEEGNRSTSVAPLPSEKVPLVRVLTGKNFSASMHSKRRSAGKPTRVEGPKGLIKGLYRSQPGRRALISLVHCSIRSPRRNLNQLALRHERVICFRRKY
ncbi:hypothetical protein ALC53_11781 [Atta colombica]|uniref:Uncharacterized protein n=1 Tax=Atta colombica TaxID=520822 RepID=A0A195B0F3_9HYME|nr:hypothetical protein ALC53_11781 [Atta colombica]